MKKLKLQIGCAQDKAKGFIGMEYPGRDKKADVQHELDSYPYPFKDNSITEVLIGYYLAGIKDLMSFFNEMSRILKKNGIIKICVPYYASARAYQDPTHLHHFTEYSFMFYNEKWRKDSKFTHYPITCNFEIVSLNHSMAMTEQGKSQETIQYNMLHYWNVIHDMVITLKKV